MGSLEKVTVVYRSGHWSDDHEKVDKTIEQQRNVGLSDVLAACPSFFVFDFGFEKADMNSLTLVSKDVRSSLKRVGVSLLCPCNLKFLPDNFADPIELPKTIQSLKNPIVNLEIKRWIFQYWDPLIPVWPRYKDLKELTICFEGVGIFTYPYVKTVIAYYEGPDYRRLTVGFNEKGHLVMVDRGTVETVIDFVQDDDGGRYEDICHDKGLEGLRFYTIPDKQFVCSASPPDKLAWVCQDREKIPREYTWTKVDGWDLYTPIHEILFYCKNLESLSITLGWREAEATFANYLNNPPLIFQNNVNNPYHALRLTNFPPKLKSFSFYDHALPHPIEILLPEGLEQCTLDRQKSKGRQIFLLGDFPKSMLRIDIQNVSLSAKRCVRTDIIDTEHIIDTEQFGGRMSIQDPQMNFFLDKRIFHEANLPISWFPVRAFWHNLSIDLIKIEGEQIAVARAEAAKAAQWRLLNAVQYRLVAEAEPHHIQEINDLVTSYINNMN